MVGIILAGGKSKRLGSHNKAFLEIEKEPLIKRQLRILRGYFKEIFIVTNSKDEYKSIDEVEIISDVINDSGPLAGILSGLLVSRDNYNFIVACDLPFINISLIRYMLRNSEGYDITVPWLKGKWEPLFAIYSKNCLKYIKILLDKRILKVSELFYFPELRIKKISEEEIAKFGKIEKIFMNINTLEDLYKLKQCIKQQY